MTTLLRPSQRLLKIFPKGYVYIRHQIWVHCRCKLTHNKLPYDNLKTKLIPDQQYVFRHHFHISNSGLTEPVEQLEKQDSSTLFMGSLFGKKVNDLMIILNLKQDVVMTDDDWEAVLESMNAGGVQGLGGEDVLMEFFSKRDPTELGISLMQYVKKKKVPSIVSRTALIAMCGKKYPDIVFREYEELLKQNVSLDADCYLKLIKGFSQTSNWKKCLEFLQQLTVNKEIHEKGTAIVLKAALANNDLRTVNFLLSEICNCYGSLFLPESCALEIYLAWDKGHIDTKTLLNILSQHKGYLASRKLKQFPEILNRKGDNFKVHWGQIIQCRCSACGQTLTSETITASQIKTLKEKLHKYISTNNTVYFHSYPNRLEKFCNWVDKTGPFDLVVDVANVYCTTENDMDWILNEMMPFREMKKLDWNVLYVLPHRFRKPVVRALKNWTDKKVHTYITEPKGNDDLFMILAVLHSGPQCYILSGDHFRDMKNNLGKDSRQLFELWQRCQQILVLKKDNPKTDISFVVLLFYHYPQSSQISSISPFIYSSVDKWTFKREITSMFVGIYFDTAWI